MDISVKLRKLRHSDYINGMGVIILGLWSTLKFIMSSMAEEDFYELEGYEGNKTLAMAIILVLTVIFLLALLMLHYYVGISAMKVGKNRTGKIFFLIPTTILLLLYTFFMPQTIYELKDDIENIDTAIVSALIDFLFILILFDIVVSTIRILILEKKLGEEGRD